MLGGAHCVNDHQGVVEAKGDVVAASTGGDGEVFVLGIALHKGAGVPVFVYCEYLVCSVLLTIDLEFCAGAGEGANLAATPRWLYAVVEGYLEQCAVGALALKRCKIGKYRKNIALEHCYCKIVFGDAEKSFLHIVFAQLWPMRRLLIVYLANL